MRGGGIEGDMERRKEGERGGREGMNSRRDGEKEIRKEGERGREREGEGIECESHRGGIEGDMETRKEGRGRERGRERERE